jgi:hypothetical protein
MLSIGFSLSSRLRPGAFRRFPAATGERRFLFREPSKTVFVGDLSRLDTEKIRVSLNVLRKKRFLPLLVSENPRVMNPGILRHSPKRDLFFVA